MKTEEKYKMVDNCLENPHIAAIKIVERMYRAHGYNDNFQQLTGYNKLVADTERHIVNAYHKISEYASLDIMNLVYMNTRYGSALDLRTH